MKIEILTLFPEMFVGPLSQSILKRAQKKGILQIKIHNLRNWANDPHKTVDDRPYGGGAGMILKIEPVYKAVCDLKSKNQKVILLTPQAQVLKQKKVRELSALKNLILICGHYEGIDERIRRHLVDEEISVGDYILTGGEIPAMVLTDAITRLIPGVLKKKEATKNESFSALELTDYSQAESKIGKQPKPKSLLDYPQYTHPRSFRGWSVPKVLLSGNHQKIKNWRQNQSLKRTRSRRPDLLK
ncbi:MAG: tRNA (guanosine(37)-N1)-methyltransferase TrmD [Candidatus Pacebacteria bacterium]|nr:tRNA (guanosine(37)-N1)-methyltransferase TrmD [Candidatus Paceibacterota bacterium]